VLYALIYAAAGSLVSRAEDLQVLALPLSLVAIGGYFLAMMALSGGIGPLVRLGSYFPFWSPFVMLTRLTVSRVEPWELVLSYGLLAAMIPIVAVLAIRVYSAGVLLYGQRPGARAIATAIVRPPAVYGPGDKETLELFRMAKMRLMLLPPRGHVSLIHVDDLARLLLVLAEREEGGGQLFEPDDGKERGWTHKQLARAIGEAVGRKNLSLSVPKPMLQLGAVIDQVVRRERAKLSVDRAAYFSHRDWVIRSELRPPPKLWKPGIDTRQGLAETAEWYRANGWL